jgi:hypothetical protein
MNPYAQLGGAAIGLVGNAIGTAQNKQDKGISEGDEDPAIRAMRKRLAAQNAQTAMSVAASQPGVNPALAQRNAQQALGQQQVRTNALTAQANAQSTLQSRAATRGDQTRRLNGTLQGLGSAVNLLGTSLSADAAGQAAQGGQGLAPAVPSTPTAPAASPLQLTAPGPVSPEGAAGLAAPPMSQAPQGAAGLATPPPSAAPQQSPEVAQILDTMNQASFSPAGQLGMRGAEPQQTAGLGSVPANRSTMVAEMTQAPLQEQALGQTPQVPGAAPAPLPVFAPEEVPNISYQDQFYMLPDEVKNDPTNAATARAAEILRERGMGEQADMIMEELLRGLNV